MTRPVSLLNCRTEATEPGSRNPAIGLVVASSRPHTPSTNSKRARARANCSSDADHEGLTSGFRPLLAHFLCLRAPFCETNDQGPRPGRWPSPSLDSAPRSASRPRSTASPRCLESASTTDVSRHEHPSETSPLETTRRPPWGDPAGFGFEILLARGVSAVRSRKTPDHLAVIQPPAATCLTARRRLQVVRRPLALSARCACARRAGE